MRRKVRPPGLRPKRTVSAKASDRLTAESSLVYRPASLANHTYSNSSGESVVGLTGPNSQDYSGWTAPQPLSTHNLEFLAETLCIMCHGDLIALALYLFSSK
eukprot:GHVT01022273.1.p1 GENE.GHVT01022273.1~~GHVT01022273.1.p1  ORF type:complete len:102 (-),score=0.11 GHVT01022273.1:511-816(-)